jgi:hypothetical protein
MVNAAIPTNTAVMRLICASLAPIPLSACIDLVISLLPFQPTINLGTSNRNRFISRSLKRYRCGASASGIRNHHGPLIAAGARKNEKLRLAQDEEPGLRDREARGRGRLGSSLIYPSSLSARSHSVVGQRSPALASAIIFSATVAVAAGS